MTVRARHSAAAACLAVLLLPLAAAAAVEERFDRNLSVSGPVSLSVRSGSGSISVTAGNDGTVRVVGIVRGTTWWRGATSAEVQEAVKAVAANPPIRQNGNTIEIGAIEDKELARRVAISYELTVPRATSLTAKTGSGSHRIASLAGPVTVSSGSGSVEIGAVEGAVEVSTGSGSVKVDGARERTAVSTGSGSVSLGRTHGAVRVRTGSGSVEIDDASGEVELSTGSGTLRVGQLSGGLQARSASGAIRITGTPTADWNLHTSSGGITLHIPAGTAFRVQANTSSGSIESQHELKVSSVSRRELSGAVGEGGALVSARSASGSIHFNRQR